MSETKNCLCCGLPFERRKKWQSSWDEVKYCSDRCRKVIKSSRRATLEKIFEEKLTHSRRGTTFCPSVIAISYSTENWKPFMEEVRQIARCAVHAGKAEILQKGKVVDPTSFRGPIRVRATL